MAYEPELDPKDIGEALERAGEWLLRHQEDAGGWAERKGGPPSVLNTAEVLLSLVRVREELPMVDQKIRRAVAFVEGQQCADGPERGAWEVRGAPDLVRTSVALEALVEVSLTSRSAAAEAAARWLVSVRNADGGWGYRRDAPSGVLPTCFALSGLLAVYPTGTSEWEQPIKDGLAFLASWQRDSGAFGDPGPLQAVRTAFAAVCLQRADRCELNVHSRAARKATSWLVGNPVEATTEVEDVIEIDPNRDHPTADYSFIFMTETFVVRAMMGSADTHTRSGPLAVESIEALYKAMEPEGGFYGRRVFSWSTARALQALASTRPVFQTFPEARRGGPAFAIGNLILGLVVLLIGAIVALSVLNKFGAAQAALFAFLVLAALLAYGLITEPTFAAAFSRLFGGNNVS